MQLSKRLETIASLVPMGSRLVDVGTDHGYIPIYLMKGQKISHCIASDVNKGPLEIAKKNIAKYQLTHIELRHGSGLQTITSKDEMDTVVIAGMGGSLIIDILEKELNLVKGMKQIILQPQSNIPEVRRYIHHIGFSIKQEVFLQDEGKYYTIIVIVPGDEKYETEYEYEYGKYLLQHPNEIFKVWMGERVEHYKKLIETLQTIEGEAAQIRQEALTKDYELAKEAYLCIQ